MKSILLIDSYPPDQSSHSAPTQIFFRQLTSWLAKAANTLTDLLLVEPETESKIVQQGEQEDESLWEVYEPAAGQVIYRRLRMR